MDLVTLEWTQINQNNSVVSEIITIDIDLARNSFKQIKRQSEASHLTNIFLAKSGQKLAGPA
jgi:hypothetical protein